MTSPSGTRLDPPRPGAEAAWVREHLGGLLPDPDHDPHPARIRGGQRAADEALAAYDVSGYASARNEVWPERRRGASRLSPYIRHGLLTLPRVWAAVGSGPAADVAKFRDELMWQEYARHLYARVGAGTGRSLRYAVPDRTATVPPGDAWPAEMACMDLAWSELRTQGWLPNQVRMWLASHWAVRGGHGWRDGEDAMFAHLLDGSRAANRLGWQWTVGAATGKAYGFSRWQVEKRAPGVCDGCVLRDACPISSWPDDRAAPAVAASDPRLRRDDDLASTRGPRSRESTGVPEAVWLTAESVGDDDPALTANPEMPVVFVFDAPLLARLRLTAKRLVFLAECLADLAERREVEVHVGDPVQVLAGRPLAATFTPVPGWRTRSRALDIVDMHPWRWLARPHDGPITSYSSWRRRASVARG